MRLRHFNLFSRFMVWKSHIQNTINHTSSELDIVSQKIDELKNRITDQEKTISDQNGEINKNKETIHHLIKLFTKITPIDINFVNAILTNIAADAKQNVVLSRRGARVRALIVDTRSTILPMLGGLNADDIVRDIVSGEIASIELAALDANGKRSPWQLRGDLIGQIRAEPEFYRLVLSALAPWTGGAVRPQQENQTAVLGTLRHDADLIDFIAAGQAREQPDLATASGIPIPFDVSEAMPGYSVPPMPIRRSVLFAQHCYYNFYYLAQALKKRGWDAACLTTEADDDPHARFYHGSDISIYDPDPIAHRDKIRRFYTDHIDRFGIVHTYGVGRLSLFPSNFDADARHLSLPWDILEWKRRGVLIGYSHSGCLDGVSQSHFRDWCPNMCSSCAWETRADICSDEKNLAWGRKLTSIVDLFCTETDPSIDFKASPQTFRAPLTFAISPDLWAPDISPPASLDRKHTGDRVIVYHAVGNFEERSRNGRNVKGTQAVLAAIETLQREGVNIALDFVDNVPSRDNRFVQVQADIIVDQLNYGRYGALAREGMMLGKPVVGRVNKLEHDGSPATACIQETPIVHAEVDTVLDVLRDLALNPAKRVHIGRASREHAIKWWSADRLAERFERVYDNIRDYGRPPAEEDVP